MSTAGCILNLDADPQNDLQNDVRGTSKPLRALLVAFASTMTLGLGLAVAYLGTRIAVSGQTASNTPAVIQTPVVEPQAVAATPLPNLYLKVPSLGMKSDREFLASMERKGVPTSLQTTQAEIRIVMGPFLDRAAMELEQRKLQSEGIIATEVSQ